MDSLRKFFGLDKMEKEPYKGLFGNEFRKPTWLDDGESDDELYDSNKIFRFQIFTNPLEMQKHFEQQMHAMLNTLEEFEDHQQATTLDENIREKYMKPGSEDQLKKDFGEWTKRLDTDLDDEIYADQLHSLLQRISPGGVETKLNGKFKSPNNNKNEQTETTVQRKTDEEKIWDRIHGTDTDTLIQRQMNQQRKRKNAVAKLPAQSGVFEGVFQGPKVFRQSIMTQTIRKPDGTYETKKIVRDADGNKSTTITRTREGKTETFVYDQDNRLMGSEEQLKLNRNGEQRFMIPCQRNIMITDGGYALPRNLW